MPEIGDGARARLSAVGVLLLLVLLVGTAVAGKPTPIRPASRLPEATPPQATLAAQVGEVTDPPPPATPRPSATANVIMFWNESITLAPGATPFWEAARPSPTESRHKIMGEDGIFGLPGWPWRADDMPKAEQPRLFFKLRLGGPCCKVTR